MANLKDLVVNGSTRILGNGYVSGNLSILNYLESYDGIHFLNSSNTIIGKITSDGTYGTVLQYGSNYINVTNSGLYWNNSTKFSLDGHTHSSVKDSVNGAKTTFAYSKEGLSSATWIAGWNNYELRAISPSNIKAGSAKVADSVAWGNVSGKPSTFTATAHKHTKAEITDFPSSMPASDVSSWAKASSKPKYTASEVGASPSGHNHDGTYVNVTGDTMTGLLTAQKGVQIGKTADYGWYNSSDRLTAGVQVARGVNVGSLLISSAWADSTKVPTNGIYTKGQIKSGVASGTAPFVVSSTTVVTNLNADLLDGHSSTYFAKSDHNHSGVYALASHKHTKAEISDFPSSMPASDVYSWAKKSSKPTYTYTEVGAAPASHSHPYLGSSSLAVGIQSPDNRDDVVKPNTYDKGLRSMFIANSTDGLNDGSSYHGVIHFKPYGGKSDHSGGLPTQLAVTALNNLWIRTGKTEETWDAWDRFIKVSNIGSGITLSGSTISVSCSSIKASPSNHNHDGVYAPKTHTHTKSQISDFPSSMPASDVYGWAKASSKPKYTALEVGASPSNHNHDGVYAPKSHSHSYLPLSGGTLSGNLTLMKANQHNTDQFINFKYSTKDIDNYSWRIGYLGSRTGVDNSFSIETDSNGSWTEVLKLNLNYESFFKNTVHVPELEEDGVLLKNKYAPVSHNHSISNVTGLQGKLDGKSNTGHGHDIATTSASGFMSSTDKKRIDNTITKMPTIYGKNTIQCDENGDSIILYDHDGGEHDTLIGLKILRRDVNNVNNGYFSSETKVGNGLFQVKTTAKVKDHNEIFNTIDIDMLGDKIRFNGNQMVHAGNVVDFAATKNVLGFVKVGSGINISNGVISASCTSIGAATKIHSHDGYAPKEHNHVITEVSGLKDALDGKSDTGHNHDTLYAKKSHTHTASEVGAIPSTTDYNVSSTGHRVEALNVKTLRINEAPVTDISTNDGCIQFVRSDGYAYEPTPGLGKEIDTLKSLNGKLIYGNSVAEQTRGLEPNLYYRRNHEVLHTGMMHSDAWEDGINTNSGWYNSLKNKIKFVWRGVDDSSHVFNGRNGSPFMEFFSKMDYNPNSSYNFTLDDIINLLIDQRNVYGEVRIYGCIYFIGGLTIDTKSDLKYVITFNQNKKDNPVWFYPHFYKVNPYMSFSLTSFLRTAYLGKKIYDFSFCIHVKLIGNMAYIPKESLLEPKIAIWVDNF